MQGQAVGPDVRKDAVNGAARALPAASLAALTVTVYDVAGARAAAGVNVATLPVASRAAVPGS
ncbi:MAG TPA: hypothetical protein VHN80_13645 [Kineosporiaceae bacterium]|nr:hypothetical protein [Kineosporiaceae bacterium]